MVSELIIMLRMLRSFFLLCHPSWRFALLTFPPVLLRAVCLVRAMVEVKSCKLKLIRETNEFVFLWRKKEGELCVRCSVLLMIRRDTKSSFPPKTRRKAGTIRSVWISLCICCPAWFQYFFRRWLASSIVARAWRRALDPLSLALIGQQHCVDYSSMPTQQTATVLKAKCDLWQHTIVNTWMTTS